MINAIVFDIGGVLIRTENQKGRQTLEAEYNLQPGTIHDLVFNSPVAEAATLGTIDASEIWNFVARELTLTPEELSQFIKTFWMGDKLDHSLVEFMQQCRPKYKTALLSNAWNDLRNLLANKYKIEEKKTVDQILISAELGVAKPDPGIFQILRKSVDCEYKEILFIDDFIENVLSAKSLGIQTIHYKPGLDLINEIKLKLVN